MTPLDHSVLEIERAVVDDKRAVAAVVQRPTFLALFIDPDVLGLKDEEVVGLAEPVIDNAALDVCQAVTEKGCGNIPGGFGL